MRIGVVYPQNETGGDPAAVAEIGRAVEAMGYDHLLAYDHVLGAKDEREPALWGRYTDRDPFHDPLMMFAYLAGLTKTIEFATGVLVLPQRQTALVARQAADLDLLSGQRLRLGVGAGWNYVEYDALGQDFRRRGQRLDEQLSVLRKLWSEPTVSFSGIFDYMDRVALNPPPRRTIPLWVGGFSPAAYRRGARLGDGFIFFGAVGECIEARARVLDLRAAAGRSAEQFGTELIVGARSADRVLRAIDRWRRAGGTHVSVRTLGLGFSRPAAHLDFLDEVRRRL
jgi:probable F420-dependent oxidoreductase